MSVTSYAVEEDVAVIRFHNPPVNGLSHAARIAIVEDLDRALVDPAVRAVVLAGTERAFSAGADVREFNTPKATAAPTLSMVIAALEESRKPVVAAIAGVCMGGGLELALGCWQRVARADARLALPEVKLGLIPGAGGTQRLPRAVGVEKALNMIVSGEAESAAALADSGLLDQVVDDDPVDAAVRLARQFVAGDPPVRLRDRMLTLPNADGYFAFAREQLAKRKGMPSSALDAVEAVAAAVGQPFDEGLSIERARFEKCVASDESRALRHMFFAERHAFRVDDLPPDTVARPIESAAVVGAGTMGGGIAISLLDAGLPVTLLEAGEEALQRGVQNIRNLYEARVRRRRISADEMESRLARLQSTVDYDALASTDVVIEAVFEDMAVKREVFQRLDAVMPAGAVLATNTSTLDVNAIAATTGRPQDVVGLHFFSPANVMRLLEVVRGTDTAPEVLAGAMALAKRIGKVAVVAGVCDGFIGNRMLEHYNRQAWFMLEEGALPQQIDAALERFGFAMGPFRVGDLAGNDIGWAIRKRRYVERPDFVYSKIADRLCEMGRYGQKTGAGWYRYEAGSRTPRPDPAVEQMIEDYSAELGVTRRPISDDEIVGRCVYALVQEGARILADGIAQRASDIDVVWLNGYGFPKVRGGPMFHADTQSLFQVRRVVRGFARIEHGDPAFWEPAPLLNELANAGKTFN